MNLYHEGVLKYTAKKSPIDIMIEVMYESDEVSNRIFMLSYEDYERFKHHGALVEAD